MALGIEFLDSSNTALILTYPTKWPDGNGFYDKATVRFLYVNGIVIARQAIVDSFHGDNYVTLCPTWNNPKKRIQYICSFLNESKAVIERKLKDEDEEYSTRELPNHYDYNWDNEERS